MALATRSYQLRSFSSATTLRACFAHQSVEFPEPNSRTEQSANFFRARKSMAGYVYHGITSPALVNEPLRNELLKWPVRIANRSGVRTAVATCRTRPCIDAGLKR